jgi:signal transduction histidine kinase/CheY-like chemotaxis protein
MRAVVHGGPQGTLFRKYAAYFAGLVSIALLASGLTALYFDYRETRSLVQALQREKARGAALRIEQFAQTIVGQLKAALPPMRASSADLEEQHFELLRLLRQAPAIIDITWVDAAGRQQLKVSRLGRDEIGPSRDWSAHPAVAATVGGQPYFGPVHFRQESEPYMTVGARGAQPETGVALAEVNLKFVWEVVSAIEVGEAGYAYVVDAAGRLVSHPDISLVLRGTDLSALEPVRAVLAGASVPGGDVTIAAAAADGRSRWTLTAEATIPALGWHVFVEQPLAEAFAPVYASAFRAGALLVAGIVLAIVAGLALARRMAAPIRALQQGATRIGEGRLQERVRLATGDELETLASEFNRMAERLAESYSGLEQKIAERTRQLAAANLAKSRFLAAASHDLRQPVHALGLYVAQLRECRGAPERERLVTKIETSSAVVSELIETLLDLSRLDADVVTPQPTEFGLQTLFNRLEGAFSGAAQAEGLRLRVRPSPLRVATDPLLLERILMNLAANAVRYTRQGGVLIGCRRRAGKARIEIWDTGIGIAPGEIKRIFEEFFQAHPHADERSRGLGLGLAIVDRLGTLLQLRIDVRSVEGRGSMFAVAVPLAAGASAAVPAVVEPQVQVRFDGALALVVDDDADARDAVAGLLASWGWRVVAAADGDDAIAGLAGASPDLVISDYRLADDELGTEVIQRVRTACGTDVSAVVVSGDVTVEIREAVHRAGLHLLHKPLQAARLRALLQHLRSPRIEPSPAVS